MKLVNPHIQIKALNTILDESNSISILKGHDVIVDALDNIKTRQIIQNSSAKLNILWYMVLLVVFMVKLQQYFLMKTL